VETLKYRKPKGETSGGDTPGVRGESSGKSHPLPLSFGEDAIGASNARVPNEGENHLAAG